MSFLICFFIFEINLAIIFSICWGFFIIIISSYHLAKIQKTSAKAFVLEHLLIGIVVVVLTYFVGNFVNSLF